jgi:dolichol-phosphate mannosyltransferase
MPLLSLKLSLSSLLRRIFSKRFLKFGIVGVSGIAVNQGVLYLGEKYLFNTISSAGAINLQLNLSLGFAILLATLNNFFWNRRWTWIDRRQFYDRPLPVQLGRYFASCGLSIALQILFTNLLAPHIYHQVANLVAIVLTSVLNFLLNDLWTFGRLRPGAKKS